MSTFTTEAIHATDSLEWLHDYIRNGFESERMPASDVAMLGNVAAQLACARYTIASKSETLAYVTRLHQEACAELAKLRNAHDELA